MDSRRNHVQTGKSSVSMEIAHFELEMKTGLRNLVQYANINLQAVYIQGVSVMASIDSLVAVSLDR